MPHDPKNPDTLANISFDILVKQNFFNTTLSLYQQKDYQQVAISILEEMTVKRLLPKFLTAVIDDDINVVTGILDVNPELLLIDVPKDLVIESQLTWHKFNAKNALIMSVERKQYSMTKLLLYYVNQLEDKFRLISDTQSSNKLNAIKLNAFKSWQPYNRYTDLQGNIEIDFPDEYRFYLQYLISVFKHTTINNRNFANLDVRTEESLLELLDKLVPTTGGQIEEHLDPELFLFAAYIIYKENFREFQSWEQRDAFAIRVIGLIQSTLIKETANIFCRGLQNTVDNFIGQAAFELNPSVEIKLREYIGVDKTFDFYRSSKDSREKLGFNFLCSAFGISRTAPGAHMPILSFRKLLLNKYRLFEELFAANCMSNQIDLAEEKEEENANMLLR